MEDLIFLDVFIQHSYSDQSNSKHCIKCSRSTSNPNRIMQFPSLFTHYDYDDDYADDDADDGDDNDDADDNADVC